MMRIFLIVCLTMISGIFGTLYCLHDEIYVSSDTTTKVGIPAAVTATFLNLPVGNGGDESVRGSLIVSGSVVVATSVLVTNFNTSAGAALQVSSFDNQPAFVVTTTAGDVLLQALTDVTQPALHIANSSGVFGNAPSGARLSVNGNISVPNTLTSIVALLSDERMKEDIQVIDSQESLQLINQLKPKKFMFTQQAQQYFGLSEAQQYGFIAQDLAQVYPEFVSIAHPKVIIDGQIFENVLTAAPLGVLYGLVGAVQQLKKEMDALREELENFKNKSGLY